MKICAVICEFNPFHNGHRYLLERARELSGCDALLCIMSGSFTQRGEMCVFDKYLRAKHAVLGGADCVIQLPSAFAVAPAEIFAKGAVKILSAVHDVDTLVFGCEQGAAEDFIGAAKILNGESRLFKDTLNDYLARGESYIKSYAEAFGACGGNTSLLSAPNSVLGTEYAKAVLKSGTGIKIMPIKRVGSGYGDEELKENFSSASAIRKNLNSPSVKNNLPDFVYEDLQYAVKPNSEENMMRYSLFNSDKETLRNIYGCGEGLENKLKRLENEPLVNIIKKTASKRYTSSRIRRILCANMLGLYKSDCEEFLNTDLYIKVLAVKKESADTLLPVLKKSQYPVITSAYGTELSGAALNCFNKDKHEYATFNHITCADVSRKGYDYMIIV